MKELTFEEAFEIAKQYVSKINYCDEYEEGFDFGYYTDEDIVDDGGPVVIKKTGKVLTFTQFVRGFHPGRKPIKEYKNLNYRRKQ